MLRKIKKIYDIYWKNTSLHFIVLTCAVMLFSGCVINRSNYSSEEALRVRIKQYFDYMKEQRYGKTWKFWLPDKDGPNKKDYVEEIKKYDFMVVDFEIMAIIIRGTKAEARMKITAEEEKERFTEEVFDYWELRDNIWYLIDAGRTVRLKTFGGVQ